ncbi:MAG: glutaminyl-peptide cyclotransferase [Actinobacteria bacterium]|nr:glutaminyl-peptide cyclotransferase [Actinomycetota bacterium]
MLTRALIIAIGLLVLMTGVAAAAPTVPWTLVATRPHDATAYTQGLVAYRGVLLESTGLLGQSTVRRVDATTGQVLVSRPLAANEFGEGLTVLAGSATQLTWTQRVLHTYNPATLAATGTRRDPVTLRVTKTVKVTDEGAAVYGLNELEDRDGIIWANVWRSDRIALIDPATGKVRAWLNMTRLRQRLSAPGEVLNGIARDPITNHMVVTGKLWPQLFVIKLVGRVPAAPH